MNQQPWAVLTFRRRFQQLYCEKHLRGHKKNRSGSSQFTIIQHVWGHLSICRYVLLFVCYKHVATRCFQKAWLPSDLPGGRFQGSQDRRFHGRLDPLQPWILVGELATLGEDMVNTSCYDKQLKKRCFTTKHI